MKLVKLIFKLFLLLLVLASFFWGIKYVPLFVYNHYETINKYLFGSDDWVYVKILIHLFSIFLFMALWGYVAIIVLTYINIYTDKKTTIIIGKTGTGKTYLMKKLFPYLSSALVITGTHDEYSINGPTINASQVTGEREIDEFKACLNNPVSVIKLDIASNNGNPYSIVTDIIDYYIKKEAKPKIFIDEAFNEATINYVYYLFNKRKEGKDIELVISTQHFISLSKETKNLFLDKGASFVYCGVKGDNYFNVVYNSPVLFENSYLDKISKFNEKSMIKDKIYSHLNINIMRKRLKEPITNLGWYSRTIAIVFYIAVVTIATTGLLIYGSKFLLNAFSVKDILIEKVVVVVLFDFIVSIAWYQLIRFPVFKKKIKNETFNN